MPIGIPSDLSLAKFNEVVTHLHLAHSDQVSKQKLSTSVASSTANSKDNKLLRAINQIMLELRAYISYGHSRNRVISMLQNRITQKIELLSEASKENSNEKIEGLPADKMFNRGLGLFEVNTEFLKRVKEWETAYHSLIKTQDGDNPLEKAFKECEGLIKSSFDHARTCLTTALTRASSIEDVNKLIEEFKTHRKDLPEQYQKTIATEIRKAIKPLIDAKLKAAADEINDGPADEPLALFKRGFELIAVSIKTSEQFKDWESTFQFLSENPGSDPSLEQAIVKWEGHIEYGFLRAKEYIRSALSKTQSLQEVDQLRNALETYHTDLPEPFYKMIKGLILQIEALINTKVHSAPQTQRKSDKPVDKPVDDLQSKEACEQFQNALKENTLTVDLIQQATSFVNTPLESGELPLHYAIQHSINPEMIEELLKYADLLKIDRNHLNAFDYAIQAGNTSLAKRIMQKNMESTWPSIKASCTRAKEGEPAARALLFNQYGLIVSPWQDSENDPLLVEKIKEGNAEEFLELVKKGLSVFTKDPKTGKTLLHLAVEAKQPDIVLLLLVKLQEESKYIEYEDDQGHTAEFHVAQAPIEDQTMAVIKGYFGEFKKNALSPKTIEQFNTIVKDQEILANKPARVEDSYKEARQRGFSGHNPLLLKAIERGDFKLFIRTCMDGADFQTVGSKTKETLLHLAVKSGQPEIVYFLLDSGVDPTVADANKKTAQQLAEESKRQDLIDLFDNQEETDSKPDLNEKTRAIEERVKGYESAYEAVWEEYSEQEQVQRALMAKHGSTGHNKEVLTHIVQGNLEELIADVKLEASLRTTSVPFEKVLEDPVGYMAKSRQILQSTVDAVQDIPNDLPEVIQNLLPISGKRGIGKSLLDLAILAADGDGADLAILAYLLSQGLDPLEPNDEGETPLSLALLKGDLKAACLMMNFGEFYNEKEIKTDAKAFNRAFSLLKEVSQERDPLNISSTMKIDAALAATYLLCQNYFPSNYIGQAIVGSRVGISMIRSCGSLFFSQSVMRAQLIAAGKQRMEWPKVVHLVDPLVQKVRPVINKAVLLEMTFLPESLAVGYTGSLALGLYSRALQVFQVAKHVPKNPGRAARNLFVQLLPVFDQTQLLHNLVSRMISSSSNAPVCPTLDLDPTKKGKQPGETLAPHEKLDLEGFNAKCDEHLEILFSGNTETKYNVGPDDRSEPEVVRKMFRVFSLTAHPDKGGTDRAFNNLKEFKDLALAKAEAAEKAKASSPSLSTTTYQTALKVGIVGVTSIPVLNSVPGLKTANDLFWNALGTGHTVYYFGKPVVDTVWRVVSGFF